VKMHAPETEFRIIQYTRHMALFIRDVRISYLNSDREHFIFAMHAGKSRRVLFLLRAWRILRICQLIESWAPGLTQHHLNRYCHCTAHQSFRDCSENVKHLRSAFVPAKNYVYVRSLPAI